MVQRVTPSRGLGSVAGTFAEAGADFYGTGSAALSLLPGALPPAKMLAGLSSFAMGFVPLVPFQPTMMALATRKRPAAIASVTRSRRLRRPRVAADLSAAETFLRAGRS